MLLISLASETASPTQSVLDPASAHLAARPLRQRLQTSLPPGVSHSLPDLRPPAWGAGKSATPEGPSSGRATTHWGLL